MTQNNIQTLIYCVLVLLLALQSLVDLSHYQNYPPLVSILRFTPTVSYTHVL
jgi:hypothetical protein